jgi:predicted HNH restriction endonuclease
MASFPSYSLAKRHSDALVKDLAKGSQVTALQPAQARDALAALERLRSFHQQNGRNVSLLCAVSEYVEASSKLNGCMLSEAIEGYLTTVVSVKRKDVAQAVEEFILADEPRTKAGEGHLFVDTVRRRFCKDAQRFF